MKRVVNTKFFTFNQNNSGGYFIENDDVAHFLIIEAQSSVEAITKMYYITEDYSEYCSCCGERWSSWIDNNDGTDIPMVYATPIKERKADAWLGSTTIIYYYDGTKEKLWFD